MAKKGEDRKIKTKATADEIKVLDMLRDIKLKDIRKDLGVGRGRPKMPSKHINREELNNMREATLKRVIKELGVGKGRPAKAITNVRAVIKPKKKDD